MAESLDPFSTGVGGIAPGIRGTLYEDDCAVGGRDWVEGGCVAKGLVATACSVSLPPLNVLPIGGRL